MIGKNIIVSKRFFCAVLALLSLGFSYSAMTAELMQNVTKVFHQIDSDLKALSKEERSNASKVKVVLDSKLLPVLDKKLITTRSLGNLNKSINDEQRQVYQKAIQSYLMSRYSNVLAQFEYEDILVKPEKYSAQKKTAIVPLEITGKGSQYSVLTKWRNVEETGQWLMFDVLVDGVSLVKNIHGEIAVVFRNTGFEGMISALNEKSVE